MAKSMEKQGSRMIYEQTPGMVWVGGKAHKGGPRGPRGLGDAGSPPSLPCLLEAEQALDAAKPRHGGQGLIALEPKGAMGAWFGSGCRCEAEEMLEGSRRGARPGWMDRKNGSLPPDGDGAGWMNLKGGSLLPAGEGPKWMAMEDGSQPLGRRMEGGAMVASPGIVAAGDQDGNRPDGSRGRGVVAPPPQEWEAPWHESPSQGAQWLHETGVAQRAVSASIPPEEDQETGPAPPLSREVGNQVGSEQEWSTAKQPPVQSVALDPKRR